MSATKYEAAVRKQRMVKHVTAHPQEAAEAMQLVLKLLSQCFANGRKKRNLSVEDMGQMAHYCNRGLGLGRHGTADDDA
jgi:hypothetical protein